MATLILPIVMKSTIRETHYEGFLSLVDVIINSTAHAIPVIDLKSLIVEPAGCFIAHYSEEYWRGQ